MCFLDHGVQEIFISGERGPRPAERCLEDLMRLAIGNDKVRCKT